MQRIISIILIIMGVTTFCFADSVTKVDKYKYKVIRDVGSIDPEEETLDLWEIDERVARLEKRIVDIDAQAKKDIAGYLARIKKYKDESKEAVAKGVEKALIPGMLPITEVIE